MHMKIKFFLSIVPFILFLTMTNCSSGESSQEANEVSTNPNKRIIGSWKLIKENGEDKSSQDITWTFMADKTWIVSNHTSPSVANPDSLEENIKQVVSFEDGWAYNAGKDVITGYLDLTSPSLITSFPYRFELTRTELMLFFEPRGLLYIIPPTPEVYYFIRK